jgi:hypothetical protein
MGVFLAHESRHGRRSGLIQPDLTLDVVLYLGLVLLAAILLMWHPAVLGKFPPILPHDSQRTAAPRVSERGASLDNALPAPDSSTSPPGKPL